MAADNGTASNPQSSRLLGASILLARWVTLALLMVLALADPFTGRFGLPTWALVAMFGGYAAAIDRLGRRFRGVGAAVWPAVLDLAAATLVYVLGSEHGGPLYVLFLLAVVCAAATLSLRGAVLYTTVAAVLAAGAEPLLSERPPLAEDIRDLGARLIVLALAGAGTAILTRRVALERAAARSVQDEAERLEETNRLRLNFISTVSHNLRTPITAVGAGLGLLETSLHDRLRPEERQLLDNGRRNIERLGMLINDLLTLNQLELGVLDLDLMPLDLRAVAASAMSTVHPLTEQKGQRLEVDLPEPLPVEGDPRRLEQAIVNLLANAHRHTPAGTRIALSGRVSGSEVLLTVHDNGPGIPPGQEEAVFRRFHSLAVAEGGSGLGLAIARGIVERHHGRLWAEQARGDGATFHVVLPRYQNG